MLVITARISVGCIHVAGNAGVGCVKETSQAD